MVVVVVVVVVSVWGSESEVDVSEGLVRRTGVPRRHRLRLRMDGGMCQSEETHHVE
jgi:hypothetical protein